MCDAGGCPAGRDSFKHSTSGLSLCKALYTSKQDIFTQLVIAKGLIMHKYVYCEAHNAYM